MTIYEKVLQRGYNIKDIIFDGKVHRFSTDGKKNKNGWYAAHHLNESDVVIVGDWSTGRQETVHSKDELSHSEKIQTKKKLKEALEKNRVEREKLAAIAETSAKALFEAASEGDHPYLTKKGLLKYFGSRVVKGILLIPMVDSSGVIKGIQKIDRAGSKRFVTGQTTKGLWHQIGEVKNTIYICEGFSTGATINEATGDAVFCAFSANNLHAVAQSVCEKYGGKHIVICADNDHLAQAKGKSNVGYKKGKEACDLLADYGVRLITPQFDNPNFDGTDFNDLYLGWSLAEVKKQIVGDLSPLYPNKPNGFFETVFAENKAGEVTEKLVPQYYELAEYLKREYHVKTSDRSCYIYDNGYYESIDQTGLKNKIMDLTLELASPIQINNFYNTAKNKCHFKGTLLNTPNYIAFKNGLFDVYAGKMIKPTADIPMFYKLDYEYTQRSTADVWDEFLNLISCGDMAMVVLIEEFIGYCLAGCEHDEFSKFLVLDGLGANGKSTLMYIMNEIVNKSNSSSVGLHSIKTERFAGYNLINKLINFCSEEGREAFAETGMLKKLTGGDTVTFDVKHKEAQDFVNRAKFVISYNKMPFFPDNSEGMLRRMIVLPFNQNLKENPHLKIKNIRKRLYDDKAAIASRCLRAYLKVIERGDFTQVRSGEDRVKEMIIKSDPVLDFVEQHILAVSKMTQEQRREHCVAINNGSFVSTEDIWTAFKAFNEGSRSTRNSFSMKISEIFKKNGMLINKARKLSRGYEGLVLLK